MQQIPMRKEFVCAECGSELRECPPPKKRNNKLVLIIAAIIVIVGGVIAAIVMFRSSNEEVAMVSSTGVVRAIADSLEQVRTADSIAAVEAEKAAKKAAVKSTDNSIGGSNLGWGSYSGPMQNGKPHGVGGTIKVTKSYSIDLKDGRGSTLSVIPGESIENTKFENGRLRAGELHRKDGTRKWFNA